MRRLEIEGVRIDCECWESRQNWGHKATLYILHVTGGVKTGPTKRVTYYNRTWEYKTFDTVAETLLEATKDLTDDQKIELTEKYGLFRDSSTYKRSNRNKS